VSATITDAIVGVKTASLHYSTDDSVTWTSLAMESTGGAKYASTIPKQTNGTVVKYYINATDSNLNTASSTAATYTVSTD
jgi:hypothetical protein